MVFCTPLRFIWCRIISTGSNQLMPAWLWVSTIIIMFTLLRPCCGRCYWYILSVSNQTWAYLVLREKSPNPLYQRGAYLFFPYNKKKKTRHPPHKKRHHPPPLKKGVGGGFPPPKKKIIFS